MMTSKIIYQRNATSVEAYLNSYGEVPVLVHSYRVSSVILSCGGFPDVKHIHVRHGI